MHGDDLLGDDVKEMRERERESTKKTHYSSSDVFFFIMEQVQFYKCLLVTALSGFKTLYKYIAIYSFIL